MEGPAGYFLEDFWYGEAEEECAGDPGAWVPSTFSAHIIELGQTNVFLKVHQQLYLLELRSMITG